MIVAETFQARAVRQYYWLHFHGLIWRANQSARATRALLFRDVCFLVRISPYEYLFSKLSARKALLLLCMMC